MKTVQVIRPTVTHTMLEKLNRSEEKLDWEV